jgi:hypothetical protein
MMRQNQAPAPANQTAPASGFFGAPAPAKKTMKPDGFGAVQREEFQATIARLEAELEAVRNAQGPAPAAHQGGELVEGSHVGDPPAPDEAAVSDFTEEEIQEILREAAECMIAFPSITRPELKQRVPKLSEIPKKYRHEVYKNHLDFVGPEARYVYSLCTNQISFLLSKLTNSPVKASLKRQDLLAQAMQAVGSHSEADLGQILSETPDEQYLYSLTGPKLEFLVAKLSPCTEHAKGNPALIVQVCGISRDKGQTVADLAALVEEYVPKRKPKRKPNRAVEQVQKDLDTQLKDQLKDMYKETAGNSPTLGHDELVKTLERVYTNDSAAKALIRELNDAEAASFGGLSRAAISTAEGEQSPASKSTAVGEQSPDAKTKPQTNWTRNCKLKL